MRFFIFGNSTKSLLSPPSLRSFSLEINIILDAVLLSINILLKMVVFFPQLVSLPENQLLADAKLSENLSDSHVSVRYEKAGILF
ncbi:hypothetical protein U14_04076 [Candidatus Moduliflexus flocculans]|uniref:Uncharacterized protein n=1 Tax=Candidatus Moduliflexus flocculans TaxID=1499966 RepID=A0A0S6W418_9BACT|nr:hypothetical protein U14_04076 [Candidatus Moduliflexus flocculans]